MTVPIISSQVTSHRYIYSMCALKLIVIIIPPTKALVLDIIILNNYFHVLYIILYVSVHDNMFRYIGRGVMSVKYSQVGS